jgi:hypothetical protein
VAKGAKEVQDYMGDYMEYAVEYRVYSIVVVAFVFFFVFDHKNFRFHSNNLVLLL